MRGSQIDIVQKESKRAARSYRTKRIHQIVLYKATPRDCIVHGLQGEGKGKSNEAVQCVCVVK